ncbi:VanZ family protein [Microcella humidisoli]|uniref:VanZ family protein n=1 Tax=Microcella humidisoli TaxID=2963406 RepID=A0ABY5FVR7_9MICO|nr:VanZ family protein [Microcella humidisoli]UTT62395.1 VanZ family protein [Microcella humidisoli]
MSRRTPAIIVGLAYTALVLLVTLGPVPQRLVGSQSARGVLAWREWFDPATWTTGSVLEFAANVLLFAPWGALALLVVGARRWWLAILAGLALTTLIEIAQIPTARISDPRDLVANLAGTMLGVLLALVVEGIRARTRAFDPAPVA